MPSANLALLGNINPRSLADWVDFDCDRRRDIAWWQPPSAPGELGTFIGLLSSNGYAQTAGKYIQVRFGELGDIPFVAEMTGDCRTDVGVYQPGGGRFRTDPLDKQSYWRWCATDEKNAAATNCDVPVVEQFGYRGDMPLPGLQFGTRDKRYLATYRPERGAWSWREIITSPAPDQPCSLPGMLCNLVPITSLPRPTLPNERVINPALPKAILGSPQAVPLPGLYDDDDVTDIAVYEPKEGAFKLLLSTNNWKYTSLITKQFGASFAPNPKATVIERSGALPLTGMYANDRRVFSLFFAGNGSWNTMWNSASPLVEGIKTCTTGNAGLDVPVSGFDRNGDGYTDLLYYTTDQPNRIDFEWKISQPLSAVACAAAGPKFSFSGRNFARVRVFRVSDMTGDGRPEMMFWDPETNSVWWTTSESQYEVKGSESSITLPSRASLL
jgi:hypothetical protein